MQINMQRPLLEKLRAKGYPTPSLLQEAHLPTLTCRLEGPPRGGRRGRGRRGGGGETVHTFPTAQLLPLVTQAMAGRLFPLRVPAALRGLLSAGLMVGGGGS